MNTLTITFSYDPKSRLLRATLENGAQFLVEPNHLGGRLASNLTLFKQRAALEEKNELPGPVHTKRPAYDEAQVRRFTPSGGKALDLDQLDINMEST